MEDIQLFQEHCLEVCYRTSDEEAPAKTARHSPHKSPAWTLDATLSTTASAAPGTLLETFNLFGEKPPDPYKSQTEAFS